MAQAKNTKGAAKAAKTPATTETAKAMAIAARLPEYNAQQKRVMAKAGANTPTMATMVEACIKAGYTLETGIAGFNPNTNTLADGVAVPLVKGTTRIHLYNGHNNIGVFTSNEVAGLAYYASQSRKTPEGKPAPIKNEYGAYRHYVTFSALADTLAKLEAEKPKAE